MAREPPFVGCFPPTCKNCLEILAVEVKGSNLVEAGFELNCGFPLRLKNLERFSQVDTTAGEVHLFVGRDDRWQRHEREVFVSSEMVAEVLGDVRAASGQQPPRECGR